MIFYILLCLQQENTFYDTIKIDKGIVNKSKLKNKKCSQVTMVRNENKKVY